ncbi:MAG: hypothetical protein ACR2Q4_09670 [Geminicoccaceae bacterium]
MSVFVEPKPMTGMVGCVSLNCGCNRVVVFHVKEERGHAYCPCGRTWSFDGDGISCHDPKMAVSSVAIAINDGQAVAPEHDGKTDVAINDSTLSKLAAGGPVQVGNVRLTYVGAMLKGEEASAGPRSVNDIEESARRLCREAGRDPDEMIPDCDGAFPRWHAWIRRAQDDRA